MNTSIKFVFVDLFWKLWLGSIFTKNLNMVTFYKMKNMKDTLGIFKSNRSKLFFGNYFLLFHFFATFLYYYKAPPLEKNLLTCHNKKKCRSPFTMLTQLCFLNLLKCSYVRTFLPFTSHYYQNIVAYEHSIFTRLYELFNAILFFKR